MVLLPKHNKNALKFDHFTVMDDFIVCGLNKKVLKHFSLWIKDAYGIPIKISAVCRFEKKLSVELQNLILPGAEYFCL